MSAIFGPIIRQGLRSAGKYVYQGLRYQERIIDGTYRKTGLYNRGVVRGIKHGLAGGQIIGGGLSLGLNAPDTPGNDGPIQPQKPTKYYSPNKTRYRYSTRTYPKCPPNIRPYRNSRRSRFSKY